MTSAALAVGDRPPNLEKTIELPDMVAYAGATWDWHRLHYDTDYLATKGLPAPLVDGQVFGAYLAEQVQDWLGPRARLRRLSFRFAQMVFAGETVRVTGAVTAVEDTPDGTVVTVEQTITVVGEKERVAVKGATAEVVLQ
ncbi:MAG: MaoC/PaaZ C-terminal domain-containing protein [Nocardiopsaceae bacterium]|nr:MaoC/PaaZ C-terminal domain-containing protein [Nocardiopsaceae bacterium]